MLFVNGLYLFNIVLFVIDNGCGKCLMWIDLCDVVGVDMLYVLVCEMDVFL